jgi:hypothetical protein
MASPAPIDGKLVSTIATPYATTTLQGSTSVADYIIYSNPNSYSFFGDFILNGNNLLFSVTDPFANKSGSYTLPLLGASNAIEYITRDNGDTNFATGVYKIVAPGDYRSITTETGIQVYGTNANDVVYGLVGSTQSNALYGGSGDDTLVSGNSKFAVFDGGSGTNTIVSGSGDNRYKIEVADNGTNIIKAQGGNDIVQVLLPSANVDWSFKRVGNDLVGTIYGINGNVSKLTIENQYTTGQIESILFYANGVSTTGSTYTGFGLNDPGVGTYSGTAQAFVATASDTIFDLRTTTRATVRAFGNEGNDVMLAPPNATRAWFYAGDGIDKVISTGLAADHTITIGTSVNATSGRLTNFATLKNANKANADYYDGVERLKFSDTNVALDVGPTQNAGSVYMLYKAAFNRAPDAGGMGYWLAQKDGGSNIVTNIAQGFVASKEFTDKYGTNPTNASYVDKLYQNVLGRAGESGGVTYWNQELDAGRISKAAVLVQFATLPEGAALVANLIANGIQYQEWVG